jgi:Skp family chaperone for outer membrane proteins
MKKPLLILLLSLGIKTALQAQDANMAEAIKVAYLTKQLNLTQDEAQKFWPVYNRYFAELKQAHSDLKGKELEFQERTLNIRKQYASDFKKVLNSDERVNKMFTCERNFVKLLRDEMRNRQQMRGMRQDRPMKPGKGF